MANSNKNQLKGILSLLLTAFVWGTSFVAQSVGSDSVEPFTFIGIRTLLGSLVLIPVFLILDIVEVKKDINKNGSFGGKVFAGLKTKVDINSIKYGAILGVILCVATNFQQFAFYYSTAGKVAFVTATYMFFIPIVNVIMKKKVPFVTWICVVMAFVGLYFLCFMSGKNDSSEISIKSVNKGDFFAFIGAIFFTAQILVIEKVSSKCDGVKLSCMQFFVAGAISFILMWIFEKPSWPNIKSAAIPILYSGVLSCGVAYTFQIIGQKFVSAPIASLIMSLESVFAVLSSAILIHERLTMHEILGCAIMFVAIIISQVADIIQEKKATVKNQKQ